MSLVKAATSLYNVGDDPWAPMRQREMAEREAAASPSVAPHVKPTNPKDAAATDKAPLHLVSPLSKTYQSIAHYLGGIKYGFWNWRNAGARASIYKAALERHMDAWWEGEESDPVDGTPHLANALACINIIIEAHLAGNLVDDRPPSNHELLARVRKQVEELMPKIRERYKDRREKNWTIADTVPPVGCPD